MVADQLAHAAPYEGIHSKLLIDASTQREQSAPDISLDGIDGITQHRWIRPSMLVITTRIDGGPSESENTEGVDEEASRKQREQIFQLMNSIWQLDKSDDLRWLFITDDDVKLHSAGANQKLLWQLTVRFDVGRDLHFDSDHITGL